MTLKNLIGATFVVAGLAIGLRGLQLHRGKWFLGGCLLLFIGLVLIRRPARGDSVLGDATGDWVGLGDLGGGHHSSGAHSSDHLDPSSIDPGD